MPFGILSNVSACFQAISDGVDYTGTESVDPVIEYNLLLDWYGTFA